MQLRTILSAAALLVISSPRSAEARDVPANVRLVLPSCVDLPFERGQFGAILEAELSAVGVHSLVVQGAAESAPGVQRGDALSIVLLAVERCGTDVSLVRLEVLDFVTKKTVAREMSLADVAPPQRARAVALAVVELLESSWAETLVALEERAAPAVPDSVRRQLRVRVAPWPEGDSPRERPISLEMLGAARLFPTRSTATLGASGTVAGHLTKSGILRGGVEGGAGAADVSQGTVSVAWVAADAGLLFASGRGSPFRIGPAVLAGYARASAEGASDGVSEETHDGLVLAGVLRGGLWSRFTDDIDGVLSVDVGYAFRGVTFLADDARAAGIFGMTMAVQIGLGWRLGVDAGD